MTYRASVLRSLAGFGQNARGPVSEWTAASFRARRMLLTAESGPGYTAWAMSCREQLQHKPPQGWPWRPNITASCVKLEVRRGYFSALVRPCNFGALGNSRQDCEERDEDSFRRYNAPGFDNLFWTFAAGSCRGHQGLEYRQHVLDPRRAQQGIRACERRQARHRVWLDDTH